MPKKSRKTTNKYPQLKFESTSRVLHYWGDSVASPSTSPSRKTALQKKLKEVQRVISTGIRRGKKADWPAEIVKDEFEAMRESSSLLYNEVKAAQEGDTEIILRAHVEYFTEGTRPVWLSPNDGDAIALARTVRNGDLTTDGFRIELAAQLFDYDRDTLRKIVKKKPGRAWIESSELQRYLVAMFVLGALSGVPEALLLEIHQALEKSLYPAIALYHLSNAANQKFPDIRDIEYPVQDIRNACRLVVKPENRAEQ